MDNYSLTGELVVIDAGPPKKLGGQPNPLTGREIDRIHALRAAGNTVVEIAVMLRRSDKLIREIIGPQQFYGDNSPFVNELLDEVNEFIRTNYHNRPRGNPVQQITFNNLAKHLGYANAGLVDAWFKRTFRVPITALKPIQGWLRLKRAMLEDDPPDRRPRLNNASRGIRGGQSALAVQAVRILKERGLKCFTASDRDVVNSIKSAAGYPDMQHDRAIHAVIRHNDGSLYVTEVYRNSPRMCKCVWLIEHKELALLTGSGSPASTNGFKPGNQLWRDERVAATTFKTGHVKVGGRKKLGC